VIGTSFRGFTDRENGQRIWLACRKVFDTGDPCVGLEWVISRKGGELRSLEISISLIRDAADNPTGFRGILRDITERIRSEETIRKLAYHDALTGLPNRFLFYDRLTMAVARATRAGNMVAVIMLDLDKFKEVNDSLGHTVGDLLLKAVSERLVRIMRRGDTVARMGGDEFMVIAPDIKSVDGGSIVGKKIVEAVRNPFLCDGHRLAITTSLGIAFFPEHGSNPEILVQRADIAMYRAKHSGRNLWTIYEEG
jgi:diguanylate cyclase (GGDEF)-like protein